MPKEIRKIEEKDSESRLDRWLKREFPFLSHGQIEKMLRTKKIKVNGIRAKADYHIQTQDEVTLFFSASSETTEKSNDSQKLTGAGFRQREESFQERAEKPKKNISLSEKDKDYIRSLVIYKDEWVIVLNKPTGLAVQGGTKIGQHIDGLLDGLKFEKQERPFIVHRLDKETSGVLLLARDRKTAAQLAQMFQKKQMQKIYWAVLKGVPALKEGKIDAPLLKKSGKDGYESVVVDKNGQKAVTYYCLLDKAGNKVSWVALMPKTGRTHQLRVHCASMNTPILGDAKYGQNRFSDKDEAPFPFSEKMHLHARALSLPHPMKSGRLLSVKAPIPEHMWQCFQFFGFDEKEGERFFEDFLKQKGEK